MIPKKASRTMTATSTTPESITVLRSDTLLSKEVFIGEDGVPAVGKVKMGFLFDVTERTVAGDRTRVTLGLLVLSALSFGFAEYLRNGNA